MTKLDKNKLTEMHRKQLKEALHLDKVMFYHYAELLDDLIEYAEKLGVEL